VLGDVASAVAWLREQPEASGRVGCIGFCLGGMYTQMAMASPGGPDAGVDLYGRLRHTRLSNAKPSIPSKWCRARAARSWRSSARTIRSSRAATSKRCGGALTATGQPFEVHIYEGAGHAFFHDGRPEYHPASAADAWQKSLDWFARHLNA
jgi:carboxymethylenebutenolidase